MSTAERIREFLAGEFVAEQYVDAVDGEAMVRVPLLGTVNANEHSFYEVGYRPTRLLSFRMLDGDPSAVCEFEDQPNHRGPVMCSCVATAISATAPGKSAGLCSATRTVRVWMRLSAI
jgi:hypothetical protein